MDKRTSKRKRVSLTTVEKIKICKLAKQNVSKSAIKLQYNIRKSTTMKSFKKNKKVYSSKQRKKDELGMQGTAKNIKRIKGGTFKKLDQTVYTWLIKQ